MSSKIIGVDMGGTKIHAAAILTGEITSECILNTPSKDSEIAVLNRLIEAIEKVYSSDCEGIGIGVPSVVDAQNGIVYDVTNIPSWKEVHLKEILEQHFKIPVYINNDSNCFALGESFFGKGKGYPNFVAITLGTGLGAGIIIEHKLYSGPNTGAGEIGAIPYKNGTIESYCASSFFESHAISGITAYQAAVNAEPRALKIFEEYGSHLAEAIKIILYTYDPQIIILGGSISNAYDFFISSIWKGLEEFAFPVVVKNLKIEKSELKDCAILGAAALIYDKTKKDTR